MAKRYYDNKNLKKIGADINLIYGQKDNGKSYSVKDEVLPDFILNGNEFVYLRRFKDEIKQFKVEKQFADYPIKKISNGEFDTITAYQHKIYLGSQKNPKGVVAGYYMSLDEEQDYAGIQLPDLGNIWFEEFFSRTYYLPNEPYHAILLFSTLARDKMPKVWLTGNNVSKLCPYIEEWGLQGIMTQKQDTIITTEVYDSNNIPRLIAAERCAETGGESGLIFGKDAKHIAKGTDRIKQAPHLPRPYYEYKPFYTLVVEREKLRFLVQIMEDKGIGVFLYVQPKTSEIQPKTRIITDNLFRSGELVTYGLQPITPKENIFFELLQAGKIFYSDNTTARDFSNVIVSFKQFNPFL